MRYQPEWAHGREVGVGQRDCSSRYESIGVYLTPRWGIRVLDFGASSGYFSRRLADDFMADCTAVDNDAELFGYPGVTVMRRLLTPSQLRTLGSFDVTLCLSVLHHYPEWEAQQYLSAVLASAPIVFVEAANPSEQWSPAFKRTTIAVDKALRKAGGQVIARTPSVMRNALRPLWVVDRA